MVFVNVVFPFYQGNPVTSIVVLAVIIFANEVYISETPSVV